MNRKQKQIKELRRLQRQVDEIRRDLGLNGPGTIVYSSPLCALEDEVVLVESDGFGGATTCVIDGNYPIDYNIEFEKHLPCEEKAIEMAERLVDGRVSLNAAY